MKLLCALCAMASFALAGPALAYQDSLGANLSPVVPIDGRTGTPMGTSANPEHVQGSFSASGFEPSASGSVGTPVSAQTTVTTGSTQTLPTGTVVIASNVGATNIAYCGIGATATTNYQPIAPGGGWFAFTVGSATQITCVTASGSTTVNTLGGSGLPTGAGGSGGSASNASVGSTGSTAPTSANLMGVIDSSGNLQGVSSTNPMFVSGSFSLSEFTPSSSGARMTPLSVTTSDSSGTLPTGEVVVVSNVGTTNPMYCNVNGLTATTSDQLITPDSWFGFTIPSGQTALHCIATGGSTTANGLGGSGVPTGSGGGIAAGSSSNASVGSTASTAPGSATYNGMLVSGGNMVGASGSTWGSAPTSLNVLGVNADVLSSALPTGAATAANQEVTVAGTSAASAQAVQGVTGGVAVTVGGTVTANAGSGTFPVSASALPLPTGAATSVNQSTAISDLGTIVTNTGAGHPFIVSHASGTSLGNSLVVKASAGDLLGFNCTAITGGVAGFCVAYNATAAPAAGTLTGSLVLDSCQFDTTARGCSLGRMPAEVAYSAGIVILVTVASSPFTYTAGATAFISADYQ